MIGVGEEVGDEEDGQCEEEQWGKSGYKVE